MSKGKTERLREEFGDVSITSSIDANLAKGKSKLTLMKYSTTSDKGSNNGDPDFNG